MAHKSNKTRATTERPQDFLAGVEPEVRRTDALVLFDLFNRVTALPGKMWGPAIIGYGRYHYRYDSGREGEFFLTGFSPRKSALSIYIMPGYRDISEMLSRLGKHKTGKSCLYINRLEQVDLAVLEEIVRDGLDYMYKTYQTSDE